MEWSGFRTAVESQGKALRALAERLREQLAGEQRAFPVRRVVAIAVGLQHLVLEHAGATGQRPEDSVFERLDTKVPR